MALPGNATLPSCPGTRLWCPLCQWARASPGQGPRGLEGCGTASVLTDPGVPTPVPSRTPPGGQADRFLISLLPGTHNPSGPTVGVTSPERPLGLGHLCDLPGPSGTARGGAGSPHPSALQGHPEDPRPRITENSGEPSTGQPLGHVRRFCAGSWVRRPDPRTQRPPKQDGGPLLPGPGPEGDRSRAWPRWRTGTLPGCGEPLGAGIVLRA